MSKPYRHALSSAKKFGGTPEDHLPIHDLMDSSKGASSDNRHRLLTHNSWFIQPDGVLERVFGKYYIVQKDDTEIEQWNHLNDLIRQREEEIKRLKHMKAQIGRAVVTRDVGEQHCIEDFGGFIPTPTDFISGMKYDGWMEGKGLPPSHPDFGKEKVMRRIDFD